VAGKSLAGGSRAAGLKTNFKTCSFQFLRGAPSIAHMRRSLRMRCATDTFLGCNARRVILVDPGVPASIITFFNQKWRQAISVAGVLRAAAPVSRLDMANLHGLISPPISRMGESSARGHKLFMCF
jgi:hypothetical protein